MLTRKVSQDEGIENDRIVMYWLGQERHVLSEELTSERRSEWSDQTFLSPTPYPLPHTSSHLRNGPLSSDQLTVLPCCSSLVLRFPSYPLPVERPIQNTTSETDSPTQMWPLWPLIPKGTQTMHLSIHSSSKYLVNTYEALYLTLWLVMSLSFPLLSTFLPPY